MFASGVAELRTLNGEDPRPEDVLGLSSLTVKELTSGRNHGTLD